LVFGTRENKLCILHAVSFFVDIMLSHWLGRHWQYLTATIPSREVKVHGTRPNVSLRIGILNSPH
jgi:hypothetical protein